MIVGDFHKHSVIIELIIQFELFQRVITKQYDVSIDFLARVFCFVFYRVM